jgi:UDP-N-acetylmuramate--alanine ligase
MSKDKFEIIDDYGHHPTEIKATLKTIKEIYNKKICVVFEPHRYSKNKATYGMILLASFDLADEIFIAPIYSASEPALPGISAEKFAH